MIALATYMGHVNIYATYWYLEAAPDLLRDIAEVGETLYGAYRCQVKKSPCVESFCHVKPLRREGKIVNADFCILGTNTQKDSALAQWFAARTADRRASTRKTMIVALERKLLIALWRLVTTGEVSDGIVLRPAS
jgi:hypothetical protein